MNPYLLVIAGMCFSLLIAVAIVLFYLRYQKRLTLQQLKLSEAETQHQKDLLTAIIQSQEEERKRIGMDLHDEVGSALSSLRMIIENSPNGEPLHEQQTSSLHQCKPIIDKVITDVRNISHNLSPLRTGAYGFLDAIEDLCASVNQSKQLNIDLRSTIQETNFALDDVSSLALYRVLAELINNTIKHAGAMNIAICFSMENGILLMKYTDDGIGLPATISKSGMGMQNIESRLNMIGARSSMLPMNGKGFGMDIQVTL